MMKYLSYLILLLAGAMFFSCSTTSHLPEGETLYTGIRSVNYVDQGDKAQTSDTKYEGGVIVAVAGAITDIENALHGKKTSESTQSAEENLTKEQRAEIELEKAAQAKILPTVKEEVDAVLAYAPNNALFGSSYHRTPLPIGLWFYNAFGHKEKGLGRWLYKTFGSEPVLVSAVSPETRATVAARVLHNYGFLQGRVDNSLTVSSNKRKAQINYNIYTGRIYTIDTVEYLGFTGIADSLIHATLDKSLLQKGAPFSAPTLAAERTRIADVLRNNGFYYYQAALATYKADTVANPYKAHLRFQPAMPLPERFMRQWYIGKTYLTVLSNAGDVVTDSIQMIRSGGVYAYSGKVRPLKAGVLFRNMLHRRGRIYRAKEQEITMQLINNLGIFSNTEIQYTPRDTTKNCDTLDIHFTGILDQRYNADLELNVTERNSDRIGPGLSLGLKKKNAFRGAELLAFDIYGSYAWKTNLEKDQRNSLLNSYQVGSKVSLDIPRIVFPGFNPRKLRLPASTSFSFDTEWLNRAGYYNTFSLGMSVSYQWRKNFTSRHTFTPLSLTFDRLLKTTSAFDSILRVNPSLAVSMQDRFIPAMEYTYAFTSSRNHRNPLQWSITIKEAGALTSGIYAVAGENFGTKDKKLFNNPFAQFLKISTELHNNFKINATTKVVTRVMGGIAYAYGNSRVVPYSEQFYVGGANSIRAFPIRSVGPGRFKGRGGKYSYMDQSGEIKLEANAELRFAVFGQLEGALFLDAGNVWLRHGDDEHEGGKLELRHLGTDLALGTGAGLRYNLDFLVVRFDAGFKLHDPASTHAGYFDTGRLSRRWAFHFAIGYPF